MPVKNPNKSNKNGSPAGSSNGGSKQGSKVGSKTGSKQGSQVGSKANSRSPSPKPSAKPAQSVGAAAAAKSSPSQSNSRDPSPASSRFPSPAPKVQSKAMAAKKEEVEEQTNCKALGILSTSGENGIENAFDSFRSIFNCKYDSKDADPMLMMFLALDDESVKQCGMHDERCEAVLHSYLRAQGSGIKRTVANEEPLFMRFIATLNNGKGTAKDFAGKGFDATFFKSLHGLVKTTVDNSNIDGLEISEDKGYRVNPLNAADSRAKFDEPAAFLQKLLGSEKYLNESNLLSHLSSTHKLTPAAHQVIDTIHSCKTVEQIKKLIRRHDVVPEILQGALVFRALGDNGKLVRRSEDGPTGDYYIEKRTELGRILSSMPADVKSKFVSDENSTEIVIPFGKVSVLVSSLFTPVKNGDKPVREIMNADLALNFTSLAVVFRYESSIKSTIRAKVNAARKAQ